MKRHLGFIFASIVVCTSLAACGSSSSSYKASDVYNTVTETAVESEYYGDTAWGDGFAEELVEVNSESSTSSKSETKVKETARKLIKNYDIDIETEELDVLLPRIESEITRLGGYVESLNTYNGSNYSNRRERYSNLTVRIPADKADEFVEFAGNQGNITNKSLSVSDVTMTYVDIEAQRDSLRVQQERLLSFMEQAVTIEEVLDIEERLTNVRYRLESLESQLRTYDSLVSYSTIRIDISEVVEYTVPTVTPKTYGEKLKESFEDGWNDFVKGLQNFTIWFVGALPTLLLWAVIIIVAVIVFRKVSKRNKSKKNKDLTKALENVPVKKDGNTPPMDDKEN